jgi:hypothetical protein
MPNGNAQMIASRVLGTVKWYNFQNGFGFVTKLEIIMKYILINHFKSLFFVLIKETITFKIYLYTRVAYSI